MRVAVAIAFVELVRTLGMGGGVGATPPAKGFTRAPHVLTNSLIAIERKAKR
jgi:hypothetical protein